MIKNLIRLFRVTFLGLTCLYSSASTAECLSTTVLTWSCSGGTYWAHLPWADAGVYTGFITILPGGFYGLEFGQVGGVPIHLASGSISNFGDSLASLSVAIEGSVLNDGIITASSLSEGNPPLLGTIIGGGFHTVVTNNGTINLGRNVIGMGGGYGEGTILSNNGIIQSFGLGTPSVDLGMNIGIFGITGDQITNSGSINTDYPDSYGILQNGAGQIDNTGSIITTGDRSLGVFGLTYEPGDAIAINNLTNGSVTVSGSEVEGISVLADGVGQVAYINNVGSVSATGNGAEAIVLEGNGQIIHSGTISAQGAQAEGIVGVTIATDDIVEIATSVGSIVNVVGDAVSGIGLTGFGSITNAGSVRADGLGATGIYLDDSVPSGSSVKPSIINQGSADAHGDSSVAIFSQTVNGVEITNDGAITSTGLDTIGIGVIGASSKVTNNGRVLAEGAAAFGVGAQGDDMTIDNNIGAQIEVTETDSIGIGVRGNNATVNNAGSVTTQSSDSIGIAVQGNGCLNGSCTITNSGEVVTHGVFSGGVFGTGSNLAILNKGSVITWGEGASGVTLGSELLGASNDGNVGNEGAIETNGLLAHGIHASGEGHNIFNAESGNVSTALSGSHGVVLGLADDLLPSSGQIINMGTVETTGTGADGVHVNGNDSTVFNLGSITTVVGNAAGIRVVGNNNTIDNSIGGTSTIRTGGDNADGIAVTGEDAIITDNGNILTIENNSNGVRIIGNKAKVSLGYGGLITTEGDLSNGVWITGDSAFVNNSASINTGVGSTYLGSQAHGIFVEGDSLSEGYIRNAAGIYTNGPTAHGMNIIGDGYAIANDGEIITKGVDSNGLQVSGTGNYVSNTGSILTEGFNSYGVHLDTQSGQWSKLTNSGTIAATGSLFSVVGGGGNELIINSGTINGNVQLRDGDDSFVITDGSLMNGIVDAGLEDAEDTLTTNLSFAGHNLVGNNYTNFEYYEHASGFVSVFGVLNVGHMELSSGFMEIYGVIEATDTINITNTTVDVLSNGLLQTFVGDINSGGVLNINDGGTVELDTLFVNTGGELNSKGSVNGDVVENGGEVNPGDSPGTLTINGDFFFNDGLLNIEIGGLELEMIDLLDISGDAIISGGNISFSFINGYAPGEGDLFEFLLADNVLGLENLSYGFAGLPTGFDFDLTTTSGGLGLITTAAAPTVPIPPSVWLFGSGLIGLIGIARRKKS